MTPVQPAVAFAVQGSTGDDLWGRWQRRAFTLPLLLVLWVVANAAVLPALVLALAVDLLRPRRLVVTRTTVFFWFFVWAEVVGLGAALLLWIGTGLGRRRVAFVHGNERLQVAWNRALLGVGLRVYGMRVLVEGQEALQQPGPLWVLARHVSTVDTVLPIWLLSGVGRRSFRFVLKRELLGDPCLDVVGNRLPNHFVRRGAEDNTEEVAGARALMRGLGEASCVVVFPEGGRFTPARRARLLERLAQGGRAPVLALAQRLTRTLPPLTEGTLAMGEANPGADLVVVAHRGLEGTTSFADFWAGRLVGVTLAVQVWRVPFDRIPRTREGLAAFLGERWLAVDTFVGGGGPAAPQPLDGGGSPG